MPHHVVRVASEWSGYRGGRTCAVKSPAITSLPNHGRRNALRTCFLLHRGRYSAWWQRSRSGRLWKRTPRICCMNAKNQLQLHLRTRPCTNETPKPVNHRCNGIMRTRKTTTRTPGTINVAPRLQRTSLWEKLFLLHRQYKITWRRSKQCWRLRTQVTLSMKQNQSARNGKTQHPLKKKCESCIFL